MESSSPDEICGLLQRIHRSVHVFFYKGGHRPDLLPQQPVMLVVVVAVVVVECFAWEIRIAFDEESQLQQNRATQP